MVAVKHGNLLGGSAGGISDGAVRLSYFKDIAVLVDLRLFGVFRDTGS